MEKLDMLIIGAGPIGLACGIAAKNAGLSYAIVEKGCLVNSLYNYPVNMTFFSTAERLEIGGVPFMTLHNKPNRQEAVEYYRRVTAMYQLHVHLFQEVTQVQQTAVKEYIITTTKQVFTAANIVIATGFYDLPNLMGIPGETLDKVHHYYKDPHYYAFQKVLVVGAQNSAVDAALETWRKGATVTMVIKDKQIGERVKYWVRPDIINRIEEGSIQVYYESSITAITPHTVSLQTPNGALTIENDFVIAMTGYTPNFTLLKHLGVQLSDDAYLHPTYDDTTMQTNMPGIYLAGVVCGGMDTHKWFIENSRDHADKIVAHIITLQKDLVAIHS
ncbi:YpdA family putative bacillithiol disulfide reductase [Limnovirga soli]|uniref:YpdA family putative bacillithiol disulfide reductase n=1 Tax=Limnovirga soli TaxID=2656915 RepID=A0A8J8JTW7_9BACT|nr:YpdA family putative bacillithiol disulfide reductase [Limnovirga soli]NNV55670.1 YpdA family putative bacillithiol disulfide reductase [Limnovirga soli]